jgi:CubicO group peptidase (beta-lactamase class C family)
MNHFAFLAVGGKMFTHKPVQKIISSIVMLVFLLPGDGPPVRALSNSPTDPIPSPILDPDAVGWASLRNLTSTQFADDFKTRSNDGYMLIDIEVNEVNGQERVGGVWQQNLDKRKWAELRNLTAQAFVDENAIMRLNGFRLIDQEEYLLGGTTYYAGIWIENLENLDWISYVNESSADFATDFDRYSAAGYLMIDIDAQPDAHGQITYDAVWVDNVENLLWVELRDLTSQEFGQEFDKLKDDYRMIDVESYRSNGVQYYAGIWIYNTNGRGWFEYRDMTSKEFGDKWLQLRDAGYRLIDYEIYPIGNDWFYAAIWRQNSERPNWPLKDQVNAFLDSQMSTYTLPGLSVAVIQQGQFVYLRGFGFADIDDDIIAHSRTVYRMASIGKAVAGALAMRLEEEGQLDVSKPTRYYVPSLPAFHTHTVSETISNRSGIGHYPDYPSISGSYATAFDAVQDLEDTPLKYTPGTHYYYSTHAYTFLGAAMEAAVGDPIGDIVFNEINAPFNLSSLREEDRSIPDPYRATLYTGVTSEVTPDDQSWKVLGGGLESSPYDLARFGIKLINGQIVVSDTLRTEMWSDKTPASNYGYGWVLGTQDGYQVVAKDGANNGARAYLRLYPEVGTVIAVMTNRKGGGHDPGAMSRTIGGWILDLIDSQAAQGPQNATYVPKPGLEDSIAEPSAEDIDPALVALPVESPVVNPTPEDLQEPPSVTQPENLLFMPVVRN